MIQLFLDHFKRIIFVSVLLGSLSNLVAQDPWDTDFIYPDIFFNDKDNNQTQGAQIFNRIITDKTAYLQPICRDIARQLYFHPSEVVVNTGLRFEIEDRRGVAGKSGSPPVITINLSTRHVAEVYNRNQSDLDVEKEIYGIMSHEMVHGYQTEPRGAGGYDGQSEFFAIIEGLADAVRIRTGNHQSRNPSNSSRRWMTGYTQTGFFFNWIANNYDKDFLRKLNLTGRSINPWSFDRAMIELTGKNTETLWNEYTAVMNQGSRPNTQFTASSTTIWEGQSVTFTNQSSNANDYDWTFDGGFPRNSTAANPTIQYNEPGVYRVTLVAHNNTPQPGIEIKDVYITVLEGAPLNALISVNGDQDLCEGNTVQLNTSVLGGQGTIEYEWMKNGEVINGADNASFTANESGVYKVRVIDGQRAGESQEVPVDVTMIPDAPVGTGASTCIQGESVDLRAEGAAFTAIDWYDDPSGDVIASGSTYSPSVFQTTDYYAQARTTGLAAVGPSDNSIGGGNTHPGGFYLVFNAYKPFTLRSARVYAEETKMRTIELRDANDNLITSKQVMINRGESRIELDIQIPAGRGLQIGCPGESDLFRNNEGVSYPYEVDGVVSIYQSTAGSDPFGFYYYLYDWEIERDAAVCTSEKTMVTATLDVCTGVGTNDFDITNTSVYPNPSSGTILFDLDENRPFEKIEIRNELGVLLHESDQEIERFHFKEFPTGMYYITVSYEGAQSRHKVILR